MDRVIPIFPAGPGRAETIDGVDYRPLPAAATSRQVTVLFAGTRVQLSSIPCRGVSVKAKATNTGNIYLGGADVTNLNGYILSAGDAIDIAIDNPNRLFIDADVGTEGVSLLALA